MKLPRIGRVKVHEAMGVLTGDRDLNAAVNLRHLVAASTSETENARGADR